MGLINFLKEKFAKRREEKQRAKEEEVQKVSSGQEEGTPLSLPAKDEQKAQEETLDSERKTSQEEDSPLPQAEKNEEKAVNAESFSQDVTALPAEDIASEETPDLAKAEEETASEDGRIPEEKEEEEEEARGKEGPEAIDEKPLSSIPETASDKQKEVPAKESEQEVMDKYVAGLDKSRMGFTDRIRKLANASKVINREYFDQLERILIEADVGVDLALELIKETASEAAVQKIDDPHALNDLLIDKMFIGYANEGGSFSTDLKLAKEGPTIVFMCGVNGGGKTTTTAKLAKKYKDRGMKVLLVAADTFRAGAVEQLSYWAERVGVDIISRPQADPASLCFDAMKKAKEENYDIVFIDTAGRLQNKKALMDELSKVVRVIKKIIPEAPHEALLVIDANTGQNGIDQAQVFCQSVPLTGIVISKMDGTSKGGIILAIRKQLSLPVRFIGLGEKMGDLEEFDLDKYLYGLLVGDGEED